MNKWRPFLISLLAIAVLQGCVMSNARFFKKTTPSDDPTYGYSVNNPVKIKNAELKHSINSTQYYLSRLKMKNGEPLRLLQRGSVLNPKFKDRDVTLYNRYTGQPIGGGGVLDYYTLATESGKDTVRLYIDMYSKGEVKIPAGLIFDREK